MSKRIPTPRFSTSSLPHAVIVDWDETLTTKDTIQYLAKVPYINNCHLQPPFSHYTDIYMSNYAKYKESQQLTNGKTCATTDEYVKFQLGMDPVEMSSIKALEHDKIFKDLTEEQLRSLAEHVQLRDGAVQFLNLCLSLGVEVIILSVNWTGLIIDEVLRRNGINDGIIRIITNEFEFDESGKTTGSWLKEPKVRTSQDKLDQIDKIKAQLRNAEDTTIESADDDVQMMYIGDSLTDLLPILNVSLPCAIKDSKLDQVLTELQFDHFSGTWFDFIKLIND